MWYILVKGGCINETERGCTLAEGNCCDHRADRDGGLLLGCTGGRLDHLLSNVSSGAYIAEHGGRCVICDKYNVMHVIKDCRLELRGLKGQTLSVLSYTDESQGVTLSGMKYPLENGTLTNAFPIGQSNIVKEDVCSVEVKHGVLLVIEAGMAH